MKIQGVNITGGIRLDPPIAPTPSGPSKFVVGAQYNDDPDYSGSVYVYNMDGTGEVKITASDGAVNDTFGGSVAMSDTKVVVGASGVNGYAGAVYVYNTDGTGEQKIVASDGGAGDDFGRSVAMSDTKVVVGASRDEDAGANSGSVYVYNTDGTGEQKIVASDGAADDRFGFSVAATDTHIVVGAQGQGVGGSVYVYNTDGTGEVKITASDEDSEEQFGSSVAATSTHIVVGAYENADHGRNSGSVYVYNTDGTGEVKITASDAATNDSFGGSVAMSDTKIVVGASGDDDAGSASGSVYVYNLDGTGEVKITASDGAANDRFGRSVAIQGDKIVVGAGADDDAGSNSGSVYVYNLDGTGEQKITASDAAAGDRFGDSVAIN